MRANDSWRLPTLLITHECLRGRLTSRYVLGHPNGAVNALEPNAIGKCRVDDALER